MPAANSSAYVLEDPAVPLAFLEGFMPGDGFLAGTGADFEAPSRTINLQIGSLAAYVDGYAQKLEAAVFLYNDTVMGPLKCIARSLGLGARYFYADNRAHTYIARPGISVVLTAHNISPTVVRGKCSGNILRTVEQTNLPAYPVFYDDCLYGAKMVPVAEVFALFGADIEWDAETLSMSISKELGYLRLGSAVIIEGDTLARVEEQFGPADRVEYSSYDFMWHVYSRDMSNFFMVGIKNDMVAAYYAVLGGFSGNGYLARTHRGVPYALYFRGNVSPVGNFSPDAGASHERINFDITNAIRLSFGLSLLEHGFMAERISRYHSAYLSYHNKLGHFDREYRAPVVRYFYTLPWERYEGQWRLSQPAAWPYGIAENVVATADPISALGWWLNSPYHYVNIVRPEAFALGVGVYISVSERGADVTTQKFLVS